VHLYLGVPGTGKTQSAESLYPGAYQKTPSQWWCSYSGEPTVILDDFKGTMPYTDLLHLLNTNSVYYEFQTKGGSRVVCADTVVITSSRHPFDWYDAKIAQDAEIARRITFTTFCERSGRVRGTEDFAEATRWWHASVAPIEIVS